MDMDITSGAARSRPSRPKGEAAALRQIATELVNTAVLTVVITSISNARAERRPVLCPLLSPAQIPPAPSEEIIDLAAAEADGAEIREVTPLARLCEELLEARAVSHGLLGGTLNHAGWLGLAAAWRRVSASLVPALDAIDARFAALAAKAPPYRGPTIRRLLQSAAAGQAPSIGRRGEIVVPGWIERRSSPRFTFLQPVWIIRDGQRQRAATVDISASGIGLVGLKHPTLGEAINIELSPSLVIEGLIVWSRDDRCGLRITTPPAGLIEP